MGRRHKRNKWKNRWDNDTWQDERYQCQRDNTKLYIEPKAYEKLVYYTQLANSEISGFGKIKIDNKKYILEDVEIFKQNCSVGGTTINGEQLAQFIVMVVKRKEQPHNWRLWWHTHFDFGVCWSGVDEMAIEGLLKDKEGAELLSICINQDLDIIGRRDTHKGNGKWYNSYEILDVRISPRLIHPTYLKCKNDIKEKVKKTYSIYRVIKNWKGYSAKYDTKVIIPEKRKLLTYTHIPICSTIILHSMGLYFNWYTGLYVRLSDGQGFTESEVVAGLYKHPLIGVGTHP